MVAVRPGHLVDSNESLTRMVMGLEAGAMNDVWMIRGGSKWVRNGTGVKMGGRVRGERVSEWEREGREEGRGQAGYDYCVIGHSPPLRTVSLSLRLCVHSCVHGVMPCHALPIQTHIWHAPRIHPP